MTAVWRSGALTIKLTADDCRNVTWQLVEQTDAFRRYIGHGTHPVTGVEITVQKTEFIAEDALLAQNAAERNEADGRRWSSGMGTEKGGNLPLVKVASTPLNVFFSEMAPRLKEGDQDFMKWWLNSEKNQAFRTRKGTI